MIRRVRSPLPWIPCALAAAGVVVARAQAQPTQAPKPKPGASPKVEVGNVMDTRDANGDGSLSVVLDITGVPAGVKLSRTVVRTATDNRGGKLQGGQPRGPSRLRQFGWQSDVADQGTRTARADLKNPSRQATRITRLEGAVELLIPSRDPDASLVLNDWRKYLGRPLEAGALQRSKVTMRVLSAAEYQALPQAQRGVIGREVSGSSLLFLVSDPQRRLAAVQFQSPDGSRSQAYSTEFSGGFVLSFGRPLPPNARLRLLFATPKAVVKVPFAMADIELP